MKRSKLLLFFICLSFCQISFGQTKKELEQQRKEIQEEVKDIRKLLSETRSKEKNVLNQLSDINLQINAQIKLIKAFKAETNALNKEIYSNEKELKSLKNELKKLKDDYAKMIYKSYKSKSQQSRIMFLLSSNNFHQAYQRIQYMKQYTAFRKAQGEQIILKTDVLKTLNDTLEIRKKEKEILAQESKKEQDKIEEEKKSQEEIRGKIKEQEKKYIAEIKKKQRAERKIDKQIEKIIRDAIAKANKKAGKKTSKKTSEFSLSPEAKLLASKFVENKGKLPWPVEKKGILTRRYGKQNHPTLSGIIIESNGVHIRTEKGSNARAIFDGTVLQIQSVSGKNAVYIQHGNYITIYNNMETVTVTKGDKVSVKQSIGKIYTDKISDKTTLKFQIWKNTTRLNPADWIYKM
ncbi:MAG: septal ring factor EnvC (AmiA/AmiB activator) [Porticoccaceae bacterium]|jgi:septal ring factor EnvC (AmiA/AmiB activator)